MQVYLREEGGLWGEGVCVGSGSENGVVNAMLNSELRLVAVLNIECVLKREVCSTIRVV